MNRLPSTSSIVAAPGEYVRKNEDKSFQLCVISREDLPDRWNTDLDAFQKMLVLRCLRPDKVTNAMQDFVSEQLGQRFIEPQSADLSLVFKDSSPTAPLIFVLSVGTDPAAALYKFAEEMKFSKKLSAISLGQGQASTRAQRLLGRQTVASDS